MNLKPDGKFQGKTAQEMIQIIQEHWPNSFSDQVLEIDKVLTKAKDSIKRLGSEMRSELGVMLNQPDLSEKDLEKRWQAYTTNEIKKIIQFALEIFEKCPEMGSALLPSLYQALQELLPSVEKTNYQILIQSVASLVDTYYDQVVKIEQELSNRLNNQDTIENKEGAIPAGTSDEELARIASFISVQKQHLWRLDGIVKSDTLPEAQKIFSLSAHFQQGKPNAHSDAIWQKMDMIDNISGFINELKYLSQEVRTKADLFENPSEIERHYMLNWIGSQADCKILIKFLLENGYIEGRSVDQFVAKHFLFNGKKKTSKQINGLHIGDRGTFVLFTDYLKIPTRS
mgnify:CR=1 FL=1|jgi:hypothetical protein